MEGALVAVLVVAAVLSLQIEARLWRAGRLSDRAMTILLLGRLPVVVFLFGIIQGYALPFTLATTALVLVPAVLLYQFVLQLLREQRISNA